MLDGRANVPLCDSSDEVMTLVIFLFDFLINFTLILFRLMRPLLCIMKHFEDASNVWEFYLWLNYCLVWSVQGLLGFSTHLAWKPF